MSYDFNTVYIDGDWLLYLSCVIWEDNYIEVKDSKGNTKEYPNITTFRKTNTLPEESFDIVSKKRLKKDDALMGAIFSIRAKIKKIQKSVKAKDVIIAVGGPSNFRDDLPLPIKYKDNRGEKPLLYLKLKNWLCQNYNVVMAEDEEADDILSKKQFEGKSDKSCISCTLDKDNRSIPGYLYNPKEDSILFIDGLGTHKIQEKGKKKVLYGTGRSWEYIQWISGDKVDNYHPQDLLSKVCIENKRSNLNKISRKLSQSSIYKDTKNFKTDFEWLQYSHDLYYSWYKDLEWYKTWDDILIENIDYLDIFQLYVDVVHMKRWPDDRVNIKEVLKKNKIL